MDSIILGFLLDVDASVLHYTRILCQTLKAFCAFLIRNYELCNSFKPIKLFNKWHACFPSTRETDFWPVTNSPTLKKL